MMLGADSLGGYAFIYAFGKEFISIDENKIDLFKQFAGYEGALKPFTCPVTISSGTKIIFCEPLIGTLDQGIYLRKKDIEALALKELSGLAKTRHGNLKRYTGVNLSFDYSSSPKYEFHPGTAGEVYELPKKFEEAKSHKFTLRGGIIGVRGLTHHAIVFNQGKIQILDKRQFDALPANTTGAMNLKVNNLVISVNHMDTASEISVITRSLLQAVSSSKPMTLFAMSKSSVPVCYNVESCRTCKVAASETVKLLICKKCKDENKTDRSLYCGVECQRKDWERHKIQHIS